MKNTRTLSILLSLATMMTLASCGGEAQLEKAYITFVTAGDSPAVFEKAYDGKAAEFDLKGVKTNSDGQLSLEWYAFETNEAGEEVEKKLEAGPVNAGSYQIVVSVPETKKFAARTVKHDYTITKVELPESWYSKGAEFPTVIHYTESGSGSRVSRNAVAADVNLAKENIIIKRNGEGEALELGTDYNVSVSIASATVATVQVTMLLEQNYSGVKFTVAAEKQA